MADDQNLSEQDIKDLQDIASKLPADHPAQKKVAALLASQPTQFEQRGGRLPSEVTPQEKFNDTQEQGYRRVQQEVRDKGGYPLTDMDMMQLGLGGMGVGRQIAKYGLKGAIQPLIKGTIGAAGGSAAGGYGGREIGRIFGHPEEGAQIGATLGGFAGGLYGGLEKTPALGTAENPGFSSKLPTRLPKNLRGDPFAPPAAVPEVAETAINPLSPYTRPVIAGQEPLVVTPDEAASLDQLQSIAAQRARERGMQYAGGVRTAGKNKVANRLFPSRIE